MSSAPARDRAPLGPASALSLTAPVAMGYVPLGAVFGYLFVQAGGPWWLALLASLIVYAGAAQFMMVPMLAAGLPAGTIALATLVINLRHVFYGLSLLERLPRASPARWYTVFALTDETYSLLTTIAQAAPARQMALIAAINQGWWLLGTAIGALLGARLPSALEGLDFVLAALFAVLAVEQWRRRQDITPFWAAPLAYAFALALAPGHALAIAIFASIAIGALVRGHGAASG